MSPSKIVRLRFIAQGRCLLLALFYSSASLASVSPAQAQDQPDLPAGITLPTRGSMYAVDESDGSNKLVPLHATEIVSNMHAASNFARSMVYAGPRATVELNGLNAAVQLESTHASFLIRLSDEQTDLMRQRLALVRLQQADNRRVVSTFSQNVFGGQRARHYDLVPVTKTDIGDSGWVKVTPEKPLAPGEYGLLLMPKDANLSSDAVYDFDVAVGTATPEKETPRSR